MAKPVDLELKKAFSVLHQMMLDTTQKLKLADIQIESLKTAKHKAELTATEIKNLSEKEPFKTYEPVGRMFVLTDTPVVLQNLALKAKKCDEKIKLHESNKAYLEYTLKGSENNLREMVQQRKGKQDK